MTAAANIKCSSFIYGYSNLSLLQNKVHTSTSMYAPEFTIKIARLLLKIAKGIWRGGSGVSGNPLWCIIKMCAIASD